MLNSFLLLMAAFLLTVLGTANVHAKKRDGEDDYLRLTWVTLDVAVCCYRHRKKHLNS